MSQELVKAPQPNMKPKSSTQSVKHPCRHRTATKFKFSCIPTLFSDSASRWLAVTLACCLFATSALPASAAMLIPLELQPDLSSLEQQGDNEGATDENAEGEEEAPATDAEQGETEQGKTEPVVPTVVPQEEFSDSRLNELLAIQSARLAYNGEILAEQRIAIVAEASGMVLEVSVEIGQEVKAGDVLAQVDSTILEAQKELAKANLESAQAQLELLMEPASEDEIAAAQATLDAAIATYNQLLEGPEPEDIRIAQSQLKQAEAAVNVAQAAYNQVRGNPQIGALPQSLELQRTTLQLESAQATYDKLFKSSTPNQLATAQSATVNARTQLVRIQEGPKAASIRISEVQVRQAETNLFLAQLALDKATVRAPIDGIIAQVQISPGSMASSGSSVFVILSHDVKVTIPVEEYRLSELELGQPAVIRVDAYPETLIEGVVTVIAPELDAVSRTVEVTLRPVTDSPMILRPGMFATVDLFNVGE